MFIRKSTAYNKDGSTRVYFQLAESVRVNGKPRNKVLASLGRADDVATQQKITQMAESLIKASESLKLFNLLDDLKADSSKEYGPFLVFKRLFKELGLEDILSSHLSSINTDFNILEALFNLILNRLTEPVSKRQMTFWEQDVEGATEFDLHQYYRAMDYLIDHKDDIERGIFQNQADLFHQELDIVLFDTTTLVYFGEGADEKINDEELLDYGFSKARRSDLKQIVVGVLMSKEGVPLAHEVFSGNTNDVQCFSVVIEQLKVKYCVSNIALVGDRGMISKSNIREIEEAQLKYILGYRMRTICKEERGEILSKINFKKLKSTDLQFKEMDYRGQRLIICYNEERAAKDFSYREEQIEKLREKLKNTKSIKQLISDSKARKFIKLNNEKTKATLDLQKIKDDELYDGVFVLTTNTKLQALQVVERYKDLWQIESGFRQLKSELQMGPIYHWKDRRIRAHIMICFMAFCLRVTLQKRLKAYFKEKSFSFTQLLRDLKSLHAITLKVEDKTVKMRTELKEGANHIFRAIGMRPPNRILHSELESVVKRLC